jgi:uncharacterized protein
MKTEILKRLSEIEKVNGFKILYACESGSRAWGFPSNDSDYDVCFIYVYPIEWYLSINKKKDDFIEVGKVLDFGGWELSKALKLFSGSNSSLFEKLQSPIVYKEIDGFRDELWSLKDLCFNPVSGIYHYLSQAKNLLELEAEEVKLKKYLYVIRASLAAEFIARNETVPPMEYKDLKGLIEDESIHLWLDDVIALKSVNGEDFHVTRNRKLDTFLTAIHLERSECVKEIKHKKEHSEDELNKLLRKWIYHT